jgi:hypothetical protein
VIRWFTILPRPKRGCFYRVIMIEGYYDPDGSPYFAVKIKVPRLNAEGTFNILADTGADNTTMHLRDAVQLLSTEKTGGNFNKIWRRLRKRFRFLENLTPINGVGGTASYFREPAQIIFTHVDGSRQGFNLDLDIVKPARRRSKLYKYQLELPSLLGMDILAQFRMVMDYPNNRLYLEHR